MSKKEDKETAGADKAGVEKLQKAYERIRKELGSLSQVIDVRLDKKMKGGIQRKNIEDLVTDICNKYNVKLEELAYIGDDVNDLELLKKVGLSATPADGITNAKKICNYICKSKGGEGAFRELVDLILETRE